MYALVLFEFEKKGVERFQVVGRGGRIEVEDSGEAETQEEVMGCAACQFSGSKGGETSEIGFGEEECVEPIYATFVSM